MDHQLQLSIDSPVPLPELWKQVLRRLAGRLGREAVRTWLGPARPLACEGGLLTLATASATSRDWIERKYAAALGTAVAEVTGGAAPRVEVVVQAEAGGSPRREASLSPEGV